MKKTLLATLAVLVPTAAAWAHPPALVEMQRVKAAAHELERAARHVHESAGRGHSHVLDGLDKESKHFHRQVEKYQRDPAHTEEDFASLADAYFHALDELHHMDHHVRDDFRSVEAAMHALMDFYGGRDEALSPPRLVLVEQRIGAFCDTVEMAGRGRLPARPKTAPAPGQRSCCVREATDVGRRPAEPETGSASKVSWPPEAKPSQPET